MKSISKITGSILILAALAVSSFAQEVRTWTIKDGTTKEGSFVEIGESKNGAKIVKINDSATGKPTSIVYNRLSAEDQAYVDKITAGTEPAAE